MIIYLYSKCSTCQKALSFLTRKKVSFIRKEITDQPPSIQELQTMLHYVKGNVKKLCNSSGQLYRDMQLSERLPFMPLLEALTLLSQNGMLVKRPFLLGDSFGFAGFNEAEWSEKI